MPSSISESGRIGSDGKLRLPMERLNQFFAHHRGEKILLRIEVLEKGTSSAMRGYYFGYIIPTMRTGFMEMGMRYSEQGVDEFLRELPESGCWKGSECRKFTDLTQAEQVEFIEFVRQYAAENLYIYIEDPKLL